MEREKGVVSAPCYSCGRDLPTVEQADGGCAAVPCPGCSKEAVEVPTLSDPKAVLGDDNENDEETD